MTYFLVCVLTVLCTITSGDHPTYPEITTQDITNLQTDIYEIVDNSQTMPRFPRKYHLLGGAVRLAFHDCGGPEENEMHNENETETLSVSICDGCIDYSNGDHAGIAGTIAELEVVYSGSGLGWDSKMSRADFWATAAIMALDFAFDQNENMTTAGTWTSPAMYFGREDCSNSPDVDLNSTTSSGAPTYPKVFPDALAGWTSQLDWFSTNFNFTEAETVAIIGAHALGGMHSDASMFTTINGSEMDNVTMNTWVKPNTVLSNLFYEDIIRDDFDWTQEPSSSDPSKYQWVAYNHTQKNHFYIMLNSDVSMIIDLDEEIVDAATGQAGCTTTATCMAQNNITLGLVYEYAYNNQIWLDDFSAAFEKMITMGYDPTALQTPVTPSPVVTPAPVKDNNSKGAMMGANQNQLAIACLLLAVMAVMAMNT